MLVSSYIAKKEKDSRNELITVLIETLHFPSDFLVRSNVLSPPINTGPTS